MKELAWIFGKSSDFSQTIVKELQSRDISVYEFGRENLNYEDFDAFRMMKVLPDIVILNANIEERIALQINKDNFYDISPQDIKNMFDEYSPVFLFFTKLIKWLEKHLIIAHSKIAHKSGEVHAPIWEKFKQNDSKILNAIHKLKELADKMALAL